MLGALTNPNQLLHSTFRNQLQMQRVCLLGVVIGPAVCASENSVAQDAKLCTAADVHTAHV